MNDEDYKRLLNDKKFMNRMAWRVAWEIYKQILPWTIALLAAFFAGKFVVLFFVWCVNSFTTWK